MSVIIIILAAQQQVGTNTCTLTVGLVKCVGWMDGYLRAPHCRVSNVMIGG